MTEKKLSSEEVLKKARKCAEEGRIKFASQDRLSEYAALLHDFMEHIVHCKGYWLSDLSTINELTEVDDKEQIAEWEKRILERYEVSIKLCKKGTQYIWEILEKISDKIVMAH